MVGWLDQEKLNIKGDDSGGEMDPHGADQRGNPYVVAIYPTSLTSKPPNRAGQHFESSVNVMWYLQARRAPLLALVRNRHRQRHDRSGIVVHPGEAVAQLYRFGLLLSQSV